MGGFGGKKRQSHIRRFDQVWEFLEGVQVEAPTKNLRLKDLRFLRTGTEEKDFNRVCRRSSKKEAVEWQSSTPPQNCADPGKGDSNREKKNRPEGVCGRGRRARGMGAIWAARFKMYLKNEVTMGRPGAPSGRLRMMEGKKKEKESQAKLNWKIRKCLHAKINTLNIAKEGHGIFH